MIDINKRWCIYIDIEGFSIKYDDNMKSLIPLRYLMEGIYKIGTQKYYDNDNKLFAHQFGDGFAIVSYFNEEYLDRPIAIAIALMRYILPYGGVAKASIAEGNFGDVSGCYPECIINNENNGRVEMGKGFMKIIPVMGTAFIKAYSLNKKSPKGSLLIIDDINKNRISKDFSISEIRDKNLISINWLKGEYPLVLEINNKAHLSKDDETDRIKSILNYIKQNDLKVKWVDNTKEYLGLNKEMNF